MQPATTIALISLAALSGAAMAADTPQPTASQPGFGTNLKLPEPSKTIIPTVNVAPARPWEKGEKPVAAHGTDAAAYAQGLEHPRWLYVLPNGDVLVAETNAPERPERGGIRNWFMGLFMKRAGGVTASANRITLLRGVTAEGTAAEKFTFIEGLNSPFGMALAGDTLYVANTDAVVKFPYKEGDTRITASPQKVADLPAGDLNHHWTKNVVASPDGKKLYASVGSNSNVGENGLDKETSRAAIIEIDIASGQTREFATGLRNPNGMDFEPGTGQLWTVVNERDELGDDLVPDYLTSVKDSGFYGWPYSYFGQHVDSRVKSQREDLVESAIVPDYGLGAHTASLGLTFAKANTLGSQFKEGAFVGQHGSWNRAAPAGYKVIFVPFAGGKPAGQPVDVLHGFVRADGSAAGRPVGVAIAKDGALLVADDVGDRIWRVSGLSRGAQNQ